MTMDRTKTNQTIQEKPAIAFILARKLGNNIQSTLQTIVAFSNRDTTPRMEHLIAAMLSGIADGESTAVGKDLGGVLGSESNFEHFFVAFLNRWTYYDRTTGSGNIQP